MPAIMESEAEATRQSKRLSGQNSEYALMRKHSSFIAYSAPSRLPSSVQSPSNTPSETFLPSAADTEDPQSTPTQKGKAPEIQIMEPTPMKLLGRLAADPESEEAESMPEDKPDSEPPSPYPEKVIRHLQSMYQELYAVKDPKNFADGWQGFAEITAAIDKATHAKQPVIPVQYPVTPQKPPS